MNKKIALGGGVLIIALVGVLWFLYGPNMRSAAVVDVSPTSSSTSEVTIKDPVRAAPQVVTNSKASPTDTTVVLTGAVNPRGALTKYWYEYKTGTAPASISNISMIGSGYAAIPAPVYIQGLIKDTTYYYSLVAENEFGRNTGDQFLFTTTHGVVAPLGSAPTVRTRSASDVTPTTVQVGGEITPNKGTTQYWFEYGTAPQMGNVTSFVSVGNGMQQMLASQTFSSLVPRTTYYYRVNAQNQFGTVNGAILTFTTTGEITTQVPVVFTGTVTSIGSSEVTLRGTVNPRGLETQYWFEYSTDSRLGSAQLKTTPRQSAGLSLSASPVSVDVGELRPRTKYYFKLVSQNSLGIIYGERGSFTTK